MTAAETTATTPRASIGMPAERVEQIRSLAKARGIAVTALIEEWISAAVASGAPGAIPLAGYSAFRDDDVIVVELAGRHLPMMKLQKAFLLATVLDAAAGKPSNGFDMPVGRALPIDLDPVKLTVGRHGRGVVLAIENEATGENDKFAAPASYISDAAAMIRAAIQSA